MYKDSVLSVDSVFGQYIFHSKHRSTGSGDTVDDDTPVKFLYKKNQLTPPQDRPFPPIL